MMRKIGLLAALAFAGSAMPALAYIGPGAGISLLGALWGVLAAVALAVGLVLFWPLRRLFRRRRADPAARAGPEKREGAGDTPSRDAAMDRPGRWAS